MEARIDSTRIDSATVDRFDRDGFVGPVGILSEAECRALSQAYRSDDFPVARDWTKGYGVSSRLVYEVATRSSIVDVVRELLGDDVILWGAQIVVRPPGAIHHFHTDAETSDAGRKSVSVWIGLRNTSIQSSLHVIPGSHRYGIPFQEVLSGSQFEKIPSDPAEIAELARAIDSTARVVETDMVDGDALFFDGRLWHGSSNTRPSGVRFAALLQYARPDTPIRIPDLKTSDGSLKFYRHPRPPCIMIHGSDSSQANRIEPAPVDTLADQPVTTSWIRDLGLPLHPAEPKGFKAYPQAKGSTAILNRFACHASALAPGRSPHSPHAHDDEEILITLSGSLDILDRDGESVHRTRPGTILYYPAHFRHTVSNPGPEVANYLMFKWIGDRAHSGAGEASTLYRFSIPEGGEKPQERVRVFERKTDYLRALRCHLTVMRPGESYEPHVDAYDVVIVTLEGEVETLGERVGPGSVVFYAAGEPHGMRSVGAEPAAYLVFEFRGGDFRLDRQQSRGPASVVKKLRRFIGSVLSDYPRIRRLLGR